MAHFAKLESKIDPTGFTSDTHLVVVRVHVVGNDNPANGTTIGENDMHVDGETFCQEFYKRPPLFESGIWKQTSYNHNFRKQYAGRNMVYDPVKDKFLLPQPHASWSLDASDDWQAPITDPTVIDDGADPSVWFYIILWNETKYNSDNTTGWEAIKSNDQSEIPTKYNWNGSVWVSE